MTLTVEADYHPYTHAPSHLATPGPCKLKPLKGRPTLSPCMLQIFSFLLRLATAPIVGALMVSGKSDLDAGYSDLSNTFGAIPLCAGTPRTIPGTPAEYAPVGSYGGQGQLGNLPPVRRESMRSEASGSSSGHSLTSPQQGQGCPGQQSFL